MSLIYKIFISDEAKKSLKKLDKSIIIKIISKFELELSKYKNPRQFGKSLKGKFGELWRYRVGDYRLICNIKDGTLTIIVIKVGHRKDIYNN